MPSEKQLPFECIEIEPHQTPAKHSVIWLHGLGADGNDFVPVVPQLHLPENTAVRFIFPHAPVRSVTLNGGIEMRAWFDITELSINSATDEPGVREAASSIQQLIAHEIERGIPAENILIAGFSQGGALALYTGLRSPQKLGGIIALSTYLPVAESLPIERSPANFNTPIFIAHGLYDPILQFSWGEMTKNLLEKLGYPISWHSYPMQHEVNHELCLTLGLWMTELFFEGG